MAGLYRFVVIVGLVAACGRIDFGDVAASDGAGDSGIARIAIESYDFSGSRSLWGYYDRTRGEECSPVQWLDGVRRCTPAAQYAQFLDAACTMPVGWGAGSSLPQYFSTTAAGGLGHLYVRGATISAAQIYNNVTGVCSGPISTAGEMVYALTDEVSADALAPIALASPSAAAGIEALDYILPDGRHSPSGLLYDHGLGMQCSPEIWDFSASAIACEPQGTYLLQQQLFSDAMCSQQLGLQSGAAVPPYYEVDPDGCVATPDDYYANGGVTVPPMIYLDNGGTCGAVSYSGTLYSLGTKVSVATLPRMLTSTPGPLQQVSFGGVPVAMYDPTFQAPCFPLGPGGPTNSCFSLVDEAQPGLFSDATCMTPLELVPKPCSRAATSIVRAGDRSFHSLGAPYAGPVYGGSSTSCGLRTFTGTVYSLGPPVDVTEPIGQLVIE